MTAIQIRKLREPQQFEDRVAQLGVTVPFEADVVPAPDGPLAQPLRVDLPAGTCELGNRFCILPMEGWDGTVDGRPTELVERRWRRFGESGAKLIWGGEAVAVRHDGRANPRQLRIGADTVDDLRRLRELLVDEHRRHHGTTDDLLVGLQLTHSGRWSRPDPPGDHRPLVAYRHPLLDPRVGISDDGPVLRDTDLDDLVGSFTEGARLASEAGFAFVDVKQCHGYLAHELLSAVGRPGPYGGSFEGRTRFATRVIEEIREQAPALGIGVRLSAFDFVPFRHGPDGVGEPEPHAREHPFAFGADVTGTAIDLAEPKAWLDRLAGLGVTLVCVSAGSPYYNPHIQRPAYFPPSDGYTPPEDPLIGVSRLLAAARELKQHRPDLTIVGSGYSYLQQWLPNVAQAVVRGGGADVVGIGRMALTYHDLPHHVLAGIPLERTRLCQTFSDCTTAPRNGLVSGCYPLDDFYKRRPERAQVAAMKRSMEARHA